MGTSFPTPYEAVVDKTKGLSVRGLAEIHDPRLALMHGCEGVSTVRLLVCA
jgi:hypothetical protein